MTKNPDRRLGCVPGIGEVAINKHPFFAYIDWSKLEARQVRPPFQPQIVSSFHYLLFVVSVKSELQAPRNMSILWLTRE